MLTTIARTFCALILTMAAAVALHALLAAHRRGMDRVRRARPVAEPPSNVRQLSAFEEAALAQRGRPYVFDGDR